MLTALTRIQELYGSAEKEKEREKEEKEGDQSSFDSDAKGTGTISAISTISNVMHETLEDLDPNYERAESVNNTAGITGITGVTGNGCISVSSCELSWSSQDTQVPSSSYDESNSAATTTSTSTSTSAATATVTAFLDGDVESASASSSTSTSTSASASDKREREKERGGFILTLPDFHIPKGSLFCIKGATGAGKSSFISALLGDMYVRVRSGSTNTSTNTRVSASLSNYGNSGVNSNGNGNGNINIGDKLNHIGVGGSVAYAGQQAWVQNETLQNNILMGRPYDEEKLHRVVDACGLTQDLEELPQGIHQKLGERGVGLSGGQKARVALARAIYSDADVMILDDVFAGK